MKKIVIAAALLMTSASAHAGTYSYEGVTVRIQDGCRSSSCVSVNAPGYGSYNGGRAAKVRKAHKKDTARVASAKKEDAATTAEASPAKAPEAASTNTAPAK